MKKIRKGQTLVEFALILPLFALIIMFLFDIGRAVYYYSVLHNAAREGARVAAVGETDINLIKNVIKDHAYGVDVNLDDIFMSWDPDAGLISISANYDYRPITPLVGAFIPGGEFTIFARTHMRLEFP